MGLNRSARTTAKKMGLRIGAARRIPTNTTTNAASNSTTRRKEGWRRAVVMVSPMPDLPSWGFLEASFMTLSLSVCAWLGCQTRCTDFPTYLEWFLLLLTQPRLPALVRNLQSLSNLLSLTGYHD